MRILQVAMILWPLAVLFLAIFFHRKQNSKDPWTGGPISWPKSLWLSNAIYSWFFYPIFLSLLFNHRSDLQFLLLANLVSWWTRGILELFMIYRWFSWSPRYGISHDSFQVTFYLVALTWMCFANVNFDFAFYFVFAFGLYMLIQMTFEVSFAFLFLRARSAHEAQENIYYASDDPKWIFINRLTKLAVTISIAYGVTQAVLLLVWRPQLALTVH